MPMQKGRRSGALSAPHRPQDDLLLVADPDDDWAPCEGHPPYATAGFVGCSDHWPPPADDPPNDHSARLAEASAILSTLKAAPAPASLEHTPEPQMAAP